MKTSIFVTTIALVVNVCWAQEPFAKKAKYQDDQDSQYNRPEPLPQQQRYEQPSNERQRPLEYTSPIPIIRFDKEQGQDGSYKALWETGNNILAQEEGYLKDLGPDPEKEGEELRGQVQQGSYTYTSPEGQIITVTYLADEKGFHPSGDHLPTPPPVSPEIQKGLDLIFAGIRAQEEEDAKNPPKDGSDINQIPGEDDGQYKRYEKL
ncbi:endocuticle structural glycoprotein SgAbd-2-like [Agrilus planipennis]|uniref:Endocuticle structural glycoprotein SgAbd-2-like n=1 Tax=Agrilus planipennis TaxID=224129 RepID=A0A1W4XDU4_AGRPL|nr:endocuticle structural glycoprotein SgAbd-2-like [Agrilus planipennis]